MLSIDLYLPFFAKNNPKLGLIFETFVTVRSTCWLEWLLNNLVSIIEKQQTVSRLWNTQTTTPCHRMKYNHNETVRQGNLS